jgi:hypothetical protein
MCNFLYIEIVEIFLSVIAWKGAWDLIDMGVSGLFLNGKSQDKLQSLMISGAIGYTLYFALLLAQYLIDKHYCRLKRCPRKILQELFYLLAYISLVCVWRTIWNG